MSDLPRPHVGHPDDPFDPYQVTDASIRLRLEKFVRLRDQLATTETMETIRHYATCLLETYSRNRVLGFSELEAFGRAAAKARMELWAYEMRLLEKSRMT